ncbi:DUF4190 domain-containing protein [Planosporangium sp. 12N6]|uniref:DUF4190 domain-containing protein n=1 Tax=Planosporangium spinosum TaxID=3402278 RepID=UPI003CE8A634
MTSTYGDEPTQPHGDEPTQPLGGPVEPPTLIDPYGAPIVSAAGYGVPGYGDPGYPPSAYAPVGYDVAGAHQPVPPAPRPTNAMAILSLVFAFVFWPLAIIFGHVGKRQIARTGEGGSGLATAGLVLGYLWLALSVCLCCGALNVIPHANGSR